MFTKERAPEAPPEVPRAPTELRAHFNAAAPVFLAALVLGVFYLGIYVAHHYSLPIGWDTPRYLYQTNFIGERGLTGVPAALPPPAKTLRARPGFAIFTLILSKALGASTFRIAGVLPVVAVTALALAAGAFLTWTLRRGPWDLTVVSLVVGLSAVVVRLMAPETYTDNLLADAVFVAALVPIASVVLGGRGVIVAMILLGLGGVLHPPTYSLMLAVLVAVGVLYLPSSWAAWRRRDEPLLATPTARLATIVIGGAALTAGTIYGLLRASPDTPQLTRGELRKKLRQDIGLYRFPLTVSLAAVGLGTLAGRSAARTSHGTGRRERSAVRFVLVILVVWGLVVLAGVGSYFLGRNTPAHRLLAFLLPIPMLGVLGFLAVGGWVRDLLVRRPWRDVAGAAVVVIGVAAVAVMGFRSFYLTLPRDRGVEWLQLGKVENAATASAYLDRMRIPLTAPVVFVLDDSGSNPLSYVPEMMYMIRSVLPTDRVEHAYVYVGDPDRYLAGQPTYRPSPRTYDANENRFWPTIQRILPRHPVALLLADFNPAYVTFAAAHPDRVVAPDVVALAGPRPAFPVPVPPDPYRFRHYWVIALLGAASFVVLLMVGLGWAVALLPATVRSFEVLALGPAFGIAALTLAALLADPLGIRLGGAGAVVPLVVAAGIGWWAAFRRLRREGPDAISPR